MLCGKGTISPTERVPLVDPDLSPPTDVEVLLGVVHTSMMTWHNFGPLLVREGLRAVVIADRSPVETTIERATGLDLAHVRCTTSRCPCGHELATAYGWMFGWRWLSRPEDGEPSRRYTLPEAVFRELPACPYRLIVAKRARREGVMPRWPTVKMAQAALNGAAWRWARREADVRA